MVRVAKGLFSRFLSRLLGARGPLEISGIRVSRGFRGCLG